jgi:hypothetical protein
VGAHSETWRKGNELSQQIKPMTRISASSRKDNLRTQASYSEYHLSRLAVIVIFWGASNVAFRKHSSASVHIRIVEHLSTGRTSTDLAVWVENLSGRSRIILLCYAA